MKRITFWALSTVSALVLLFGYHTSTAGPLATAAGTSVQQPISGTAGSSSGSSSGASSGAGSSPPATSSGSQGASRSTASTVTGDVAQTQWGPVQVRLTIASSTITKVDVVQYPNGNPRDEEINAQALPVLIQETVSSQNAQIDMVSGATVTSTGYLESLQSALDKAGL